MENGDDETTGWKFLSIGVVVAVAILLALVQWVVSSQSLYGVL